MFPRFQTASWRLFALQVNSFAVAPPAFAAEPVDEVGHDFVDVAAFAFGLAGVGLFALGGVDRAGDEEVGAQVLEAAPFVGDAAGEVGEGGFGCAEAPPGSPRFAPKFLCCHVRRARFVARLPVRPVPPR